MSSKERFGSDKESAAIINAMDEETLDTSTSFQTKLAGISRRDFHRIAGRFGLTSVLTAAAGMGGLFSADALAQTTNTTYEKRFKNEPKHVLKLGTVFNQRQHNIQRAGVWDFVVDLEERTEGAIRVEILDSAGVCAEEKCVQQAMQGILDIGNSSTQNAAASAPWLNALDWPFMFQSRGQMYNFFFSPESETLFRKQYRERHGMEFLFSLCELRQLFMGLKWQDREPITSVTQLAGTKNRATNTQLGRIAMQLMDLNPVPVAWVEVLDAMKSGLVDGMETWTTACTAFNLAPVVSKYVGINFIPGTQHTAIRTQSFEALEPELQDAVMESAYWAQVNTMLSNEAGLSIFSGLMKNPPEDTILGKNNVEMNFLSDEAIAEAEEIASPSKPEYGDWHERLNEWGGYDVYNTMKQTVRAFPKETAAIDVEPRRWWRSA